MLASYDIVGFVARCRGDVTTHRLVAEYHDLVLDLGFSAVACGGWVGRGRESASRFYFNTWPADWLEIYQRENLIDVDPIIDEAQFATTPYLWTDLRKTFPERPVAARAARFADDYGWRQMMCVPIHGPARYAGLVVAASKTPVIPAPAIWRYSRWRRWRSTGAAARRRVSE